MKSPKQLSYPLILVLGLAPGIAHAAWLQVGGGSEVEFTAKITGGSFVAESNGIAGGVEYDAALGQLKSGRLVVRADSFATGMSLRDSHMRDKYLEAQKFPEITCEIIAGPVGATGAGQVKGLFTVKGVRKEVVAPVTVTSTGEGKIQVVARFSLSISDFGIPQPKFAVVKMDPILNVTVTLQLLPKAT